MDSKGNLKDFLFANFKKGLISTGCNIEDIGLSLTPTVYYAQFKLGSDAIAMITASHNENGWTGVKMGIEKGLTHTPDEMNELKEITLIPLMACYLDKIPGFPSFEYRILNNFQM